MQATRAPSPSSSTNDLTTDSRSSPRCRARWDRHEELGPRIAHVVQQALVGGPWGSARRLFRERRHGLVHVLAAVVCEDRFEIGGGTVGPVRVP